MRHATVEPSNEVQTGGLKLRWARHYDPLVKLLTLGKDRALRMATVEKAGLRPGEAVLDVGCGTGSLTLAAKARVGAAGQVFGIDAAGEMVAFARAKAARAGLDITFQAEAIERLSFASERFDAVLSSLMMHHLPGDLKRLGMSEVYRVLKPGGRFVIVDFADPNPGMPFLGRILAMHMVPEGGFKNLERCMREAGFGEIRTGMLPSGYVGSMVGRKKSSAVQVPQGSHS